MVLKSFKYFSSIDFNTTFTTFCNSLQMICYSVSVLKILSADNRKAIDDQLSTNWG